jgi:hypothetical protein
MAISVVCQTNTNQIVKSSGSAWRSVWQHATNGWLVGLLMWACALAGSKNYGPRETMWGVMQGALTSLNPCAQISRTLRDTNFVSALPTTCSATF